MKRIMGVLLVFSLVMSFFSSPAHAQVSQNIVLSCLDATPLDPANQTINDVAYHHLLSLTNREKGVFAKDQPVYIIRSLARVFCNPNDNDPECVKDSQNQLTPCIQEKVGANICNQNCPWGNHVCKKDNGGAGTTVCCMPLYTKQGPYFECAKDKNGEIVCPQSVMSEPGQNNGIHPTENGHIETGYESSIIMPYNDKASLIADPEGNINISAAQSYTRAGLDHGFYGMQVLSDQAILNNEAFRYSLKLALFTQTEITEPSAVNCTTVYWDPYGKIIDSLRLEPIYNLPVLLKNLDPQGQVVNTSVNNNPTFKNPDPTDLAGNFNFAVPSGTYFLEPIASLFNFPISNISLTNALNILQVFDPEQEYFARDKVYNSLTEPIIEREGFSERRDLILEPKDPNYSGTTPVIMYAETLRHEDSQLVRGRTSHPKSIIKLYLGNVLVSQVETDLKGGFNTIVPQALIDNNPGQLSIYAEKTPISPNNNQQISNLLFNWLVKKVLAQQNSVSPPYNLPLVPVRISGFVFNQEIKVQPNSVVKLTVPSMGGISYSQTLSDENGYINISQKNLPPFDFVLLVDDKNSGEPYQLTIDDFNKTNTVFFAETGQSLYNTKVASTQPNEEVVNKVIEQTPKKVLARNLSFNQKPNPYQNQAQTSPTENITNNGVFVVVFIAMLLLVVIVAFVIIQRNKSKNQIYY